MTKKIDKKLDVDPSVIHLANFLFPLSDWEETASTKGKGTGGSERVENMGSQEAGACQNRPLGVLCNWRA